MALARTLTTSAFAFVFSWVAAAASDAPDDLARKAFKKGVTLFQQKQYDQAAPALTDVPELGGYLSLYKHWFLGQTLIELGKYKEAEPEVAKIIQSQASSEMKYQAQFLWGDLALRQENYAQAVVRLTPLEKKWRHSYRMPEVLFRLMLAELKQKHVASACRRARKLYTTYPAHATVMAWGSDLAAVEIDGKTLPCQTEGTDFQERVRSLQWAGESEKAHQEIVDLMAKAPESDKLRLDLILAGFMVNEGNVDDALNLLVRYYPQQKSSVPFLMLLGKAAARSGEYQTAVGAYERAFEVSPRTKSGREALFQAAYLSYQFQDYDGAVRKFQQFAKANPRSGLARDAEWHLAWLQYLRNDFKGALAKFEQVAKNNQRKRKKNDQLQERLLYWMAMANIRLDHYAEARAELEQITQRNAYSYYGLAAQARLEAIQPKLAALTKRVPAEVKPVVPKLLAAVEPAKVEEEDESEEDITEPVGDAATASTDGAVKEGPEAEGMQASDFKDPALRARIDVALKLIQLGLPELARWELWEVERKTSNQAYLRTLISAYEGINSFHRSASIAELAFGKERETGGFDGAHGLWTSAYPQAFKPMVTKFAKLYTVAPEWVWSIMRTESLYKADVISPVGAKGLMQLMEYTARNLNRLGGGNVKENPELLKPEVNIQLGTQYLARLGQKFKGQLPLVAAAYNAGPHRVEGWLVNFGHLETDEFVEHIPFLETRNYVKKVVRSHTFYRRLYEKDKKPVEFLAKALGVPIPSRASTRETWESL